MIDDSKLTPAATTASTYENGEKKVMDLAWILIAFTGYSIDHTVSLITIFSRPVYAFRFIIIIELQILG